MDEVEDSVALKEIVNRIKKSQKKRKKKGRSKERFANEKGNTSFFGMIYQKLMKYGLEIILFMAILLFAISPYFSRFLEYLNMGLIDENLVTSKGYIIVAIIACVFSLFTKTITRN